LWNPDPYRFDHKGVQVSFKTDLMHVLRLSKTPVVFSMVTLATFSLTECAVEQMRDERRESTYVSTAIAGAVTGAVMGSLSKRIDVMSIGALLFGTFMGMVEYNGGHIQSNAYHIANNLIPSIPPGEKESDEVKGLKEKYPAFKDL
jgi:hypothetical protein